MNNGLFDGWGSGMASPKKPMQVQKIESSCWVVPPNEASHVSFLIVGGGGGGGGAGYNTATGAGGGGGGGGGGSAYRYRVPLKAFQVLFGALGFKCTVGAGGTAGIGASTSPGNGTAGGAGGISEIYYKLPLENTRVSDWAIRVNNGTGGGGGTSTAGGGAGGGGSASIDGRLEGFNGSAGSTSFPPGPPVLQSGTRNYPYYSSLVFGGAGGGGSGASGRNLLPFELPNFFGSRVSLGGGGVGYSIPGRDSRSMYGAFVDAIINGYTEAPTLEQLYFLSIFGGNCGTGGDNAATGSNGGNGGDGWNGTGGAGGAAAGGPSSVGGNGGRGGSGFMMFFWEFLQ